MQMPIFTPIEAIRFRCLDCCGNQPLEVRLCPATNCPLYPYRLGKRPDEETRKEVAKAVPLPWLQEILDNRQKRADQAKERYQSGKWTPEVFKKDSVGENA